MRSLLAIVLFISFSVQSVHAQKRTVAQMKAGLQQAQNPLAYARDTLKKRYKLDTVVITRIRNYTSIADSLGYHGQIRKVYGPYEKGKVLVQVLAKLPNTFNRISQIYLDASVFSKQFADSLSDAIIQRVGSGSATFEQMAQTYSMGGEGVTKGDLGWIAQGVLIPEIDKAIGKHKKGEVFKVWTDAGVHIIKKTENPKQDHGFALMMRVFL
ncbi:MAG TPA: peptidylprolyl isomerase [Chitinophagaceae bacterium]|nr:peptidylprolyl isomerase [Chitinophagaceae bacterium]